MLSYKYPIFEPGEASLISVQNKEKKMSLSFSIVLISLILLIGVVVVLFSPLKLIQLIVERIFNR
jgi:hypothetical protein